MDGTNIRINGMSSFSSLQKSPSAESAVQNDAAPLDTFGPGAEDTTPAVMSDHKAGKSKKQKALKEYTILAYDAASNDLETYIVNDVKEMESCPPSEHYTIAAQLSRYHISDLTREFLADALSKSFGSRQFKKALQEYVPDQGMIEKYGELLKDHYVSSRIALILLRRNPLLTERLDKLVESTVRDASGEDKNLNKVLEETVGQIISEIGTRESAKENQKIVSTLMAGGDHPAVSAFEKDALPEPGAQTRLGDDILRITGDFIRGTEGTPRTGPGQLSDTDLNLAEALGGRRDSILFVDSSGEPKFHQGDYSKYLDWVDGVEMDREPLWRGVKRFEIVHDDDPSRINSTPLANLGYKDMSKVNTLAEFITWGMKKFPAKHYIVMLSNHGAGFLGAEEDRGNMLSLPDIRRAFELAEQKTGKTPDIIAFDACLMAQAEVAYELKDAAQYLVASEEVIGGDGYPYKAILPAIDKAISEGRSEPGDIAAVFVEEGKKVNEKSTFTLSAINLAAMEDVVSAADRLATHILEGKAKIEDVRAAVKQTQHFNARSGPMPPYDDYRDLGDLAEKLDASPAITDPEIKQDIATLREALKSAVVKEQHMDDEVFEGSKGLSIYAPRRKKSISIPLIAEYDKTLLASGTSWGELVKKLADYDALVEEAKNQDKKPKLTFVPLPGRPV